MSRINVLVTKLDEIKLRQKHGWPTGAKDKLPRKKKVHSHVEEAIADPPAEDKRIEKSSAEINESTLEKGKSIDQSQYIPHEEVMSPVEIMSPE